MSQQIIADLELAAIADMAKIESMGGAHAFTQAERDAFKLGFTGGALWGIRQAQRDVELALDGKAHRE